jgi:DNA-binding response OmpR family regulator
MHLVLIIEDDQAIQNVLRMLFEANGFRAVVAGTRREANRTHGCTGPISWLST